MTGIEIFDVKSEPILGLELLEYKIKSYPEQLTSAKTLFFLSATKAYVLHNGILTDQTSFYLTIKQNQENHNKTNGKKLSNMKDLVEELTNKDLD